LLDTLKTKLPEEQATKLINDLTAGVTRGMMYDAAQAIRNVAPDLDVESYMAANDKYYSTLSSDMQARNKFNEFSDKNRTYFQGNDKELVALHNITADNLIYANKQGGLAVPSIAITKRDNKFDNFGEITLVGTRDLVDPKNRDVRAFGADIYSPRYPNVKYKLKSKSIDNIRNHFKDTLKFFNEVILNQ
jgi:hypothetical protein